MRTQERNHPPVSERTEATVGQHIRQTADHLRQTVAQARVELEDSLDEIETKFTDARDTVVDKTRHYARTTNKYVKKNPWSAIGISAGVAFLAGMLIGRRRNDE